MSTSLDKTKSGSASSIPEKEPDGVSGNGLGHTPEAAKEVAAQQKQALLSFRGLSALPGSARRFVLRQKPNYRVTVTRAALSSFLAGLTTQYNSIYAAKLGAGAVQIGALNSVRGGIGSAISLPAGWLVDRYGVKKFYVVGIGLTAAAAATYAIAPHWIALIPAFALMAFSLRFVGTGCSVLCADQLSNRDRATGQNACNSIASVFLALAPMIGAALVTAFGGLTAKGLRPLYGIQFAGYVLIVLYVAARLREPVRSSLTEEKDRIGVIEDFRRIFRNAPHLRRWLVVSCLSQFPLAMTFPFLYLFAEEVKGAGQYTLSLMTVATVVAHILFGIPFGRLADRLGRKKIIYMLTPLWYLCGVLLVSAQGPAMLVLAGALWGFYPIMTVVTSSMSLELVPVHYMGRWAGLRGVFAGLVTVPAPLIGGLIWRHVGPMYVFIIPIALDMMLRLPLLATIPETLWKENV